MLNFKPYISHNLRSNTLAMFDLTPYVQFTLLIRKAFPTSRSFLPTANLESEMINTMQSPGKKYILSKENQEKKTLTFYIEFLKNQPYVYHC